MTTLITRVAGQLTGIQRSGSSPSPLTLTYPNPTAAKARLLVCVTAESGGAIKTQTLVDNKGNTWSRFVSGSSQACCIWYCLDAIGGSNHQVTIDPDGDHYLSAVIDEYTSAGEVTLDQTSMRAAIATSQTTGPVTTINTGGLYIGALESDYPIGGGITTEASWTNLYTEPATGTLEGISYQTLGEVSVQPAGTYTATWTLSGSPALCTCCLASFVVLSPPPPTPSPLITSKNTLNNLPLYDPFSIRENRQRFRRDMLPALERANSFYCPVGRYPSRGWVLLSRDDYNNIDKYSNELVLQIGFNGLPPIQNLSIVQAQCVTRGKASDKNAIYLVELTDSRSLLFNKWFQFPLVSNYNLRSPVYHQDYYYNSTQAGTPFTWSEMLEDIWEQMDTLNTVGPSPNILGPWPGLPIIPTGTPEGFSFAGVPAWIAFNDVLEYLGMMVACDLTKTNPFTIVNIGSIDPVFMSVDKRNIPRKEDDLEWIDIGAGRVPTDVTVLFRRRNDYYGSEETVRNDTLQWVTSSIYPVNITGPSLFSNAKGTGYLWSDFTVRYDQDGDPLPDDIATANAIANERVTQYYAKIYRQTLGYMTRTYTGALPFSTGSQVDGVKWYQDYSSQKRHAWKTQIVRGPYPPWEGLWDY